MSYHHKKIDYSSKDVDQHLATAIEVLLSQLIAQPWAFGSVAQIIPAPMFGLHFQDVVGSAALTAPAEELGKVGAAAHRLFSSNGSYTALSLSTESGVAFARLLELGAKFGEFTLYEAADNFSQWFGVAAERRIASYVLSGAWQSEGSVIQVRGGAENMRREMGVMGGVKQDNSVTAKDDEFRSYMDGVEMKYPVTPFLPELREKVPHFGDSDYIVVGGRTGFGKSYFALNQAVHNALNGVKSVIVNLEMSEGEVRQRIFQIYSGIVFGSGMNKMGAEKMREAMLAWEWAKSDNLIRVVNPGRDIAAVKNAILQAQSEWGAQFAAVDYFGLLRDRTMNSRQRHSELESMSGDLRALQLAIRIPLMVLAQVNRESERTQMKRPALSNLGGTTALENDATIGILIYRPSAASPPITMDEHDVPYPEGYVDFTVAKARSHASGTIEARFHWIRGFTSTPKEATSNQFPAFQAAAVPTDRPDLDADIPF